MPKRTRLPQDALFAEFGEIERVAMRVAVAKRVARIVRELDTEDANAVLDMVRRQTASQTPKP